MILEVAVSKGVLHTHDDLRHVRYIPTMHFFSFVTGIFSVPQVPGSLSASTFSFDSSATV